MMGTRQLLKGGAEYDVVTRWRRVLCYTTRAGVCRKIKRQMARRRRREARALCRGKQ